MVFFVEVEHLFIEENRYVETKDYIINDTLVYMNYSLERYAPVFTGVLEKNEPSFKSFFKSTTGWEKMNNLDTANPVFEGRIPAPAFRVIVTD